MAYQIVITVSDLKSAEEATDLSFSILQAIAPLNIIVSTSVEPQPKDDEGYPVVIVDPEESPEAGYDYTDEIPGN